MKTKLLFIILPVLIGLIVNAQTTKKDTIPVNWKTYTNQRLGITFKYPFTWVNNGKDAEVVNLTGTITAIEINFIDTVSSTTLLITYHLPPNGAELYKFAVSQFNSAQGLYAKDAKQIKVAGKKAIEAFQVTSVDGKEHLLNPPLRLILVDFLDKSQKGEFQLQFNTPLIDGDIEILNFKRLLSSFKFTH